jgi:predicted enzyme related to lactoylglutathione lyase
MIKGVHAMFYSKRADELRTFIKDTLGLAYTDVGHGWLIFDVADAEVGCHPTTGQPPTGTHNVSFYCDDIEKTVAELTKRGVEFQTGIDDRSYGRVTRFTMPGNVVVELYEPRYKRKPRPKKAKSRGAAAGRRKGKAS